MRPALLLPLIAIALFASEARSITDTAQLRTIGIKEKPGAQVPRDISLTDHRGRRETTGRFFDGKKPSLLHLVFYTCPHNCRFGMQFLTETANTLASGAAPLKAGDDYTILTVSFDLSDTTEIAAQKAAENYAILSGGQDGEGMRFFISDASGVKRLTEAVGYSFRKEGEGFDHQSALIVLTPEGKVARYLYGIQHDPKDVRLALLEAADGKIGGSGVINKVLLFCYKFDPVGGKYALRALFLVKVSGAVTLLALTAFLYRMWRNKTKSEGD
ncbi:MAG: hypothetical protein OXF52_06005 [Candidatus Dadabacteria bacterium]|nr:hypothetical protein [Candidatus Dadabacteria bacterium]